jgi:hypothetical protein
VWRVTVLLLALAGAAVWHVSLLWRLRETPALFGALLAGVFMLVLLARGITRAAPAHSRTRLMRETARLNGIGLVFVAFLLGLLFVFHLEFERAASDGRSYFIQVRSLVMDRDVDFANDEAAFGGHGASQYPIGTALLWSPFYGAAHAWLVAVNQLGADLRTDGYYYPYQRAIGLATLLYGFAGLVLIYRLLRAYFARRLAAAATLGLCLTTFIVWYLTVENSMSHGASLFATTLFLFLWHRFRPAPSVRQWALLGVAAGIMAMVRWQDAVFALFALGDLLWAACRADSGSSRRDRARGVAKHFGVFAAVAALTFAPQLIAWQAIYGDFLHVPSGEHDFRPALIPAFVVDVLFSSNRGLLTWTPVLWIALGGLVTFFRRDPRVALVLTAGFLAQVWANGAVDVWWGGAGFGARRFASSAAVFALGLAAALDLFRRRPWLLPSVALAGLVAFNTIFMRSYRDGALEGSQGVQFDEIVRVIYDRVGNPLSFPVGAFVAWRYDVELDVYDRMRGRTYSDVTIDLGEPGDDQFLGRGWSGAERGPDLSFRWTDAATSTILVPLKPPAGPYLLEINWAPFIPPDMGPQIVRVDVNGSRIASVRLNGGFQADQLTVPREALRPNFNQLRFHYDYAVSPKARGLSQDPRTLAVQVDRIRFRPAGTQ